MSAVTKLCLDLTWTTIVVRNVSNQWLYILGWDYFFTAMIQFQSFELGRWKKTAWIEDGDGFFSLNKST